MGSTVVKSDREEKVSTLDKKKGGKIRSQIINISILMGLLICLVPVHGKPSKGGADCSCSDKTVETNTELKTEGLEDRIVKIENAYSNLNPIDNNNINEINRKVRNIIKQIKAHHRYRNDYLE